jgi:putative AlgH/UPF0301 family transcriptional regulator
MNTTSNSADNKTTTSWAYDAGFFIETGSIVLSKVESTLGCHDLQQPYFHKCAVLVLEHDEDFTKGIILNRPTNLVLKDEDIEYQDDDAILGMESNETIENNNTWSMMFGGDIAGLYDDEPTILCLHSITTKLARQVSDAVLKNVMVTSHAGALTLVNAGEAKSSDFFVFYGFSGWESGQLLKELKRGSWGMVATDSETIWEQLEWQKEHNCSRSAGLEMWQNLTDKIGKKSEEEPAEDSFSDLMLKEWTTEMLCVEDYCDDNMIFRALEAAQGQQIGEGSLVRGSSLDYSPFLLEEQLFHKSTMLVFQEDEEMSVGLLLNHPSKDMHILKTPKGRKTEFNIRYGGPSDPDDDDPFIWLHSSKALREADIGLSLGDKEGIWTCTGDEVGLAIDKGLAVPAEFMPVQGFSVWEKEAGAGGIAGQVLAGNFEAVSQTDDKVWRLLLSQQPLSESTLDENLKLSSQAWAMAGKDSERKAEMYNGTAIGGMQRRVFGSNMKVSDLADDALRNWITIFLLGDGEYSVY